MDKIKKIIITAITLTAVIVSSAGAASNEIFRVANMSTNNIYWKAENLDVTDNPSANPLNGYAVYDFSDQNAVPDKKYTIIFSPEWGIPCTVTYDTQGIVSIYNLLGGTCKKINPRNMVIL